jgi:hypothetical protein
MNKIVSAFDNVRKALEAQVLINDALNEYLEALESRVAALEEERDGNR